MKKRNPFIGATCGAWAVFLLLSLVAEWKAPWALWVWGVWLSIVTLAPIIWWFNQWSKQEEIERRGPN